MGLGYGSLGRAVASNTRDPQFESSHWRKLSSINSIEKTKIKKKEARNGPIKKIIVEN